MSVATAFGHAAGVPVEEILSLLVAFGGITAAGVRAAWQRRRSVRS
jgi:hypothetical protein